MGLILVAVGGNALIRTGQIGSAAQQFENARRTARDIVIDKDRTASLLAQRLGADLLMRGSSRRTAWDPRSSRRRSSWSTPAARP
jgi:carbamate kinase